jgi:hypothetical protein
MARAINKFKHRTTLRTIAESPPKKAPVQKEICGGFWLLFVDRRLSRVPPFALVISSY